MWFDLCMFAGHLPIYFYFIEWKYVDSIMITIVIIAWWPFHRSQLWCTRWKWVIVIYTEYARNPRDTIKKIKGIFLFYVDIYSYAKYFATTNYGINRFKDSIYTRKYYYVWKNNSSCRFALKIFVHLSVLA